MEKPLNYRIYTPEDLYACNWPHFLGYPLQKSPMDMMAYQTLIYDVRPDVIIECGTWHGASALYFATLMECLNHGVVFTIDIAAWPERPKHERIVYITGSSVDEEIVKTLRTHAEHFPRVVVILDSDHRKDHVAAELQAYAQCVTVGSYLVVEDTNIHGHPIRMDYPEGPWEALHDWLPGHPEFEIDRQLEPIYTNNPDGWLRRK
jgi:cephalosporin hydroxylase